MKRTVVTIPKDETVEHARSLMARHRIRHLPVLEGKRLVGIITDRDVRCAMEPRPAPGRGARRTWVLPPETRVADAMTPDPVTVTPATDIEEAARLLVERRIGCLPVVDSRGAVVDIVSETDILLVFMEMMGVLASSSRIDVALGRGTEDLERATAAIHRAGGKVISIGMSPGRKGAPRAHHFRLTSCDTGPIVAALRKAGFRVLGSMG